MGKLVKRCSHSGILTRDKERKIQTELNKRTREEDVTSPPFEKKLKEIRHAV
jgi:hypothetical protein